MSLGKKPVVSKRSARPFLECDMEKQDQDFQGKRTTKPGEMGPEGRDRQSQSPTSTASTHSSQSSLAPSPILYPTEDQRQVDSLVLEAAGRRRSDSGLRDAFHPPALTQQLAYPSHDLEKGLPSGPRPVNFGIVVPGVYRSSFPQSEDYAFIEGLKLKTIVTLVQKDFPQGYGAFLERNSIQHAVFDMKGTKKEDIPITTMKSILRVVLDRRNHPLLIHCNHGKHRTGCVIGIVRKLSGWDLGNIISEYKTYADPKVRECDINYITGFELANISNLFRAVNWPFRTTRFLRAAAFVVVMLVVWILSGHTIAGDRIVAASERELLNED